jgi:hypothetical protein
MKIINLAMLCINLISLPAFAANGGEWWNRPQPKQKICKYPKVPLCGYEIPCECITGHLPSGARVFNAVQCESGMSIYGTGADGGSGEFCQ